MAVLPIHVDIWGNKKGIFKVALKPADTFSFTEHGTLYPDTAKWIEAYLAKKKWPLPPLDLSDLPPFTLQVLEALTEIPCGKTLPYGQLASRLGRDQAARAVGRACGANPIPLFIPCHRVISSDGTLGGFAFGLEVKRHLLDFESLAPKAPLGTLIA